jgi:hypothetical protein
MSKPEKMIEKMKQNPQGWQIEDLQSVARRNNITWRHESGSHCIFFFAPGKSLSVPAHRPIKQVYVKQFLSLLEG